MTLLVRDEEDVVGANLRYHLSRGVDHVIVTDNRSVDGTRDIVQEFVNAGTVTLIDEARDDYNQHEWVTRMARMAANIGADWVINSDADEMWWPSNGDLKSTLERIPADRGSVLVKRSNALPLRVLKAHPFKEMVLLHTRSVNGCGDPLPGKVAHRGVVDVEVEQGNHSVSSQALGPLTETESLSIFHFPYRSYAQFARKIANGGAAYNRNPILPPTVGSVWRHMYERLNAGTLQQWYDALPHADDAAIAERLARGEVVEDRRLADYLHEYVL